METFKFIGAICGVLSLVVIVGIAGMFALIGYASAKSDIARRDYEE